MFWLMGIGNNGNYVWYGGEEVVGIVFHMPKVPRSLCEVTLLDIAAPLSKAVTLCQNRS